MKFGNPKGDYMGAKREIRVLALLANARRQTGHDRRARPDNS